MNIRIYDTVTKRYLTDDELEGKYYFPSNTSGEVEDFEFNLLTCKVMTLENLFFVDNGRFNVDVSYT